MAPALMRLLTVSLLLLACAGGQRPSVVFVLVDELRKDSFWQRHYKPRGKLAGGEPA